MPHYFISIRDERNSPDRLGMTLPDLKSAKREALILAGTLLAEPGRRFWKKPEWSIDVMDVGEHLLFRLTFYRGMAETVASQSVIR